MKKKIKPLHNYVVIEKVEDATVSSGGIHFVRAPKHQPCIGKVLAVGPGVMDDDETFRDVGIDVGDHIAYLKPYAKTFEIDKENIITMVKYQGVLGKVKR